MPSLSVQQRIWRSRMQFQYESNEHSVPREPARSNIVNNVTSLFFLQREICETKNKNKIHQMQVLRDCCFDYMKTGFFLRDVCIYSALSHSLHAYLWGTRLNTTYTLVLQLYTFLYMKHRKTWMQHNETSSEANSKSKFLCARANAEERLHFV